MIGKKPNPLLEGQKIRRDSLPKKRYEWFLHTHMKRRPTLPVTGEMQIQPQLIYQDTSTRTAKSIQQQELTTLSADKAVEHRELSYIVARKTERSRHFGK